MFDGGVLDREWLERIVLDPGEPTGYEFHEVASIAEATIPRLARRITHAAYVREQGTVAYLENGEVPA
ncbi:hypothetical protein [Nocardiopsis sp. CC223A]|uniref:hypothetical protein n=1 Tax=Nocardiopsis sp. CC223A TaxID=3044051 RepID=UPI00278C0438|nr:hypothetical protein [Nocardiopsis sp. CC223A]